MKKTLNDIKINGYDDFFKTDEIRQEEMLGKIREIPIEHIMDFPNHPFHFKDKDLTELVESVTQFGILLPTLVRPINGKFEMVSGHRRKRSAALAGLDKIPCIVKNMTDDEATIVMVDTNIQRENILPSERAWAYKMKLDALKHQGKRNDLTSAQFAQKSKTSVEKVANDANTSKDQVRRFIRLTELIPPLLQMVDDKKIAFNPAVEISYLSKREQEDLLITIESELATPSLTQAKLMRRLSEENSLTIDKMLSLLSEEKPNQKEQIKIPRERILKYFPRGTETKLIEETIIKALDLWQRKERKKEQSR